MDIVDQIYNTAIIQPIYNIIIGIYGNIGQNSAILTCIILGLISAGFFIPLMITSYFDQQRTRQLKDQIEAIQANESDPEKQQQKIMKLLRRKQIKFQSESIFLAGIAIVMAVTYPIFSQYWQELHPDLLYSFVQPPASFSPMLGNINLGYSSPALSLIPAILLFFELRQSYKEQSFLTSFVDRWYSVILPLFIYFLIFWLPSALSVILASALAISLYIRFLLNFFTSLRRSKVSPATK